MPKTATGRAPDREADRALAKALVENKALSVEDAKVALGKLRNGDVETSLEAILLESNTIQEEVILETKASLWNVPFIDLRN